MKVSSHYQIKMVYVHFYCCVLGNYGVRGMRAFKDKATEVGICIATTNSVSSSGTDEEFDKVIQNLKSRPNASVVVCFCEGLTIKALLRAMERNDAEGKFLLIGRLVAF